METRDNFRLVSSNLEVAAIKLSMQIMDGNIIRACSVSSQSMWIERDWMGLNPKQVKLLHNFFQSHPIHVLINVLRSASFFQQH
jgi:hypothetical protein